MFSGLVSRRVVLLRSRIRCHNSSRSATIAGPVANHLGRLAHSTNGNSDDDYNKQLRNKGSRGASLFAARQAGLAARQHAANNQPDAESTTLFEKSAKQKAFVNPNTKLVVETLAQKYPKWLEAESSRLKYSQDGSMSLEMEWGTTMLRTRYDSAIQCHVLESVKSGSVLGSVILQDNSQSAWQVRLAVHDIEDKLEQVITALQTPPE